MRPGLRCLLLEADPKGNAPRADEAISTLSLFHGRHLFYEGGAPIGTQWWQHRWQEESGDLRIDLMEMPERGIAWLELHGEDADLLEACRATLTVGMAFEEATSRVELEGDSGPLKLMRHCLAQPPGQEAIVREAIRQALESTHLNTRRAAGEVAVLLHPSGVVELLETAAAREEDEELRGALLWAAERVRARYAI